MNNQQLSKIALVKSGHKRERFNFSRDVNTTADFGSVQPAQCKLLVPGTKSSVSTKSLTRLAPMVAPTFGRLKFKMWHEFVPLSDVCLSFDQVMSQQYVYSSGENMLSAYRSISTSTLRFLSFFALCGARCTAYVVDGTTYHLPRITKTGATTYSADSWYGIAQATLAANGFSFGTADSFTQYTSNHATVHCGSFADHNRFTLPLGNDTYRISGTDNYYDFGLIVDTNGAYVNEVITLDNADYIIELPNQSGSNVIAIAVRLSSVGKRWRKLLIGLGYQLDFKCTTPVSILPILAFYKAYWNLFGLTQWQSYENTSLYILLRYMYDYRLFSISDNASFITHTDFVAIVKQLINDLLFCFVTENPDYVSSHLPSTAVSPSATMPFVDVDGSAHITLVDSAGQANGAPYTTANGHSFIDQLKHGELDSEYLKRLYKWTNRNTVIGRKIAEVLRAQGLGKYVDGCTTDFIGYTEDNITISDVVSSADTSYAGNQGALLGEYGGKGLQYTEGKTFTYSNDQFGYWITLMAIVPDTGYMQQFDPTLFATDKFAFYNPEFDSLGYEAQTKRIVQGGEDWNDYTQTTTAQTLDATFGYAPRYFGWKFAHNINNGDMTLRGVRSNYLPYTLDKFIAVNEKTVRKQTNGDYKVEDSVTPSSLPNATGINHYRYVGRFGWLGNYNRIFANAKELQPYNVGIANIAVDLAPYVFTAYDNFLIHSIFDFISWSPMLAVEDSFETKDEDEKADMKITKA